MGRRTSDPHGGLINDDGYGSMKRNDEVVKGIKVATWQWPADWPEPLIMPPQLHRGMWVQQLHFGFRSVVRACDAPTFATSTSMREPGE